MNRRAFGQRGPGAESRRAFGIRANQEPVRRSRRRLEAEARARAVRPSPCRRRNLDSPA